MYPLDDKCFDGVMFQVFGNNVDVLDITLNDSMYSVAKRRRVVTGIPAVMDVLTQDTWAW